MVADVVRVWYVASWFSVNSIICELKFASSIWNSVDIINNIFPGLLIFIAPACEASSIEVVSWARLRSKRITWPFKELSEPCSVKDSLLRLVWDPAPHLLCCLSVSSSPCHTALQLQAYVIIKPEKMVHEPWADQLSRLFAYGILKLQLPAIQARLTQVIAGRLRTSFKFVNDEASKQRLTRLVVH